MRSPAVSFPALPCGRFIAAPGLSFLISKRRRGESHPPRWCSQSVMPCELLPSTHLSSGKVVGWGGCSPLTRQAAFLLQGCLPFPGMCWLPCDFHHMGFLFTRNHAELSPSNSHLAPWQHLSNLFFTKLLLRVDYHAECGP